jgi:dipeptidyl aminopeptidase/acylaminoacyl peptidase
MKNISISPWIFGLIIFFGTSLILKAQEDLIEPSFEQVLSLHSPGSVALSNNGKHIAYTVRKTDWKNNRYDTEIWLSKNGGEPFQLTRTPDGSSGNPQWSPDDAYLTFTTSRGNKNQIYAIRIEGGEAFPVTRAEDGVQGYQWMPDGESIVFTTLAPEEKKDKSIKERYGAFAEDESVFRLSWLYSIPFDPTIDPSEIPCYKKDTIYQTWPCVEYPKAVALIDSVDFTIRGFNISPDGKYIVFSHTPDPLIMSFMDADIGLLDLQDTTFKTIVSNPSADFASEWSPDSRAFLYDSDLQDTTSNFYKNNNVFIYNLEDGKSEAVGTNFDENISIQDWNLLGIYFTASQRTQTHLFRMDPNGKQWTRVPSMPNQIGSVSFSKDGNTMAFTATHQDDLSEVYTTALSGINPKSITNFNQQINNWKTSDSKVVTWKSKDGAEIEGVVHMPKDFDPQKKYPLLVMIHGGPTGVDRPTPVLGYVYPMNQWVNKGAVVLRVNYRGSAGYGEAFRSLNVENLGVGDAWDVLSGVDYLIEQGYIDEEKMGCMGWSQGGYISAFLTTNTDRFKAISVGAGISNWMTYYVNTDIHPFTRQYLKATPWSNEEVYRKTSPMTNINQASTPTLIQHGEFDTRVPTPNAYELLQGLQDNQVPAKLIIYKGFGHGITKPKERLAAVWHNWQWFNKYLWGEEVEMPVGE